MNKVQFSFLEAAELRQPSDVPTQTVSPDADLRETLAAVSPEKAGFRRCRRIATLAVAPTTATPFGPTRAQLVRALLAGDEEEAANNIRARFDVTIELTPNSAAGNEATALPVDFYELAQLDAVARTGTVKRGVIVSVFLSRSQVYALHVSREQPLGEALRSVDTVRDYMDANPDAGLLNPLKGIDLDPAEACGPRTNLVCLSTCEYSLQPKRSWLMPFPYFSRDVAMRKGTLAAGQPEPCSNCLACVRCCPADIHPSLLHHHIRAGDDKAYDPLGLDACIECGLCTLVCPSRLPLFATIEKARRAVEAEAEEPEEAPAS